MIKAVSAAVAAIEEGSWQRIDYPQGGEAQIAETVYGGRRLIVRRTRLLGPEAELWPDWRHFAFLTNRSEGIAMVEAEHRDHAVVEQVISDLKDHALAHFPSGDYDANAAWTVLAALAHNLLRWTQLLGLPDTTVRAARTQRRRLLAVPGRLTRHARGLDASSSRPLALPRRLPRRAQPHPSAPPACLIAQGPHRRGSHLRPPGTNTAGSISPDAPAETSHRPGGRHHNPTPARAPRQTVAQPNPRRITQPLGGSRLSALARKFADVFVVRRLGLRVGRACGRGGRGRRG